MSDQIMNYRGYQVVLKPTCEGDGMWFGGYDIRKNGETLRSRTNLFPGFLYFKAACTGSLERAKIEIDNLAAGSPSIVI
jgi:hypothetical protein